jgi:hypothetical protein
LSSLVLDEVEDNGTVLRLRARTTTPEAACLAAEARRGGCMPGT